MFDSVAQNNGSNGARHFMSLLLSLIIHAAAVCILAILPLMFINVIHQGELLTFLLTPPPPPPAPSAPSPPSRTGASARDIVLQTDLNLIPTSMPYVIPPPPREAPRAVDIGSMMVPGVSGAGTTGLSEAITALIEPVPPEPPEPVRPPEKPAKIKIGGDVLAARLLLKVDPVYPRPARLAHVSGTVVLQATIDVEGNVGGIRVLSGPVLLNQAAVDAVRQWKYMPTVLNGEPVPVLAIIKVIFNLR